MRVWSGLVGTAGGSRLGNGGWDRSNEAPTGGLGTELGKASFVCLSLGPTENQSINQRSGTQYILVYRGHPSSSWHDLATAVTPDRLALPRAWPLPH